MKTIVLSGGGTAGHVTPLIAVATELRRLAPATRIVYIGQYGDKNCEMIRQSGLGVEVKQILAGKWRRFHKRGKLDQLLDIKTNSRNIRDVLFMVLGLLQSIVVLIRLNPSAVFLKGGYVCVPVGWAAGLLKKPLMTHDSDTTPGLANRLVSPFVRIHAVAEKSEYGYPASKVTVVGIPIRHEYGESAGAAAKYREELNIDAKSEVLFVGGSSQGAKNFDDIFEGAAKELLTRRPNLQIIQVFGRLNEQSVDSRYAKLDPSLKARIKTYGFVDDVYKLMAASDLLVGRAGATFISEVAALRKPLVVVPAPQLTGGHQIKNAEHLASLGALIALDQRKLVASTLASELGKLLDDKQLRSKLADKLHELVPSNAAKSIATMILELE